MSFILNATKRTEKGEKTRATGTLPGVFYGAGKEATSISLNLPEFLKLYKEAGESSLIDLNLDGKAVGKALVQEVQYNPVSDRMSHVDFRLIDMNKSLIAKVVLRYVGESGAIKASGGTLVTTLNEVEVECLPKDLVSHIDVDISVLKTFEDVIKVKDLKLPAGIKILSPQGEGLVAKAQPAITEEEIKAMEEAAKSADVSKIEVVEKKKEVEEGEEGAAPAVAAAAPKAEEKKEKK